MLDLLYFDDDVFETIERIHPQDITVMFNTESFMKDENIYLLEESE